MKHYYGWAFSLCMLLLVSFTSYNYSIEEVVDAMKTGNANQLSKYFAVGVVVLRRTAGTGFFVVIYHHYQDLAPKSAVECPLRAARCPRRRRRRPANSLYEIRADERLPPHRFRSRSP